MSGVDSRYRELVKAALEVSRRRAAQLRALRQAVLDGDEAEVWRLAKVVTGLEEDRDASS